MSEASASPPPEQLEEFVIEDVETIRVLADPLRMRILNELQHARTVKELARMLDVPQTRLYYHVKMLERARLIRVVARRPVSGIEERTYQTTAKSTVVSPNLAGALAESGAVGAMFQMVATQLEIALQGAIEIGTAESSVLALSQSRVWLRPDQTEEFQTKLADLIGEFAERPDAVPYELFIATFRRPDAP